MMRGGTLLILGQRSRSTLKPEMIFPHLSNNCFSLFALKFSGRRTSMESFSNVTFLSPCNSIGGDIAMRPFMCGLVSGWVRASVCPSRLTLWAQYRLKFLPLVSLSKYTCQLLMMREGTLLILGLWGQRSRSTLTLYIKPCGHNTNYSFSPITFKLHMSLIDDKRRNPIHFGMWGQRSRSYLTLCCIRLCLQDTDYSLSPIPFKLHM